MRLAKRNRKSVRANPHRFSVYQKNKEGVLSRIGRSFATLKQAMLDAAGRSQTGNPASVLKGL